MHTFSGYECSFSYLEFHQSSMTLSMTRTEPHVLVRRVGTGCVDTGEPETQEAHQACRIPIIVGES